MITIVGEATKGYYNLVILRMVITPSSAMDVYNEYFASHPLTHFCQIWLLKPFVSCALEVPLSVEMQNNYALGNFNASLFATEGIASVGLWLAPITVLICGLVVALGNRLSAGLPSRFILLSAGVLPATGRRRIRPRPRSLRSSPPRSRGSGGRFQQGDASRRGIWLERLHPRHADRHPERCHKRDLSGP